MNRKIASETSSCDRSSVPQKRNFTEQWIYYCEGITKEPCIGLGGGCEIRNHSRIYLRRAVSNEERRLVVEERHGGDGGIY